MDELIRTASSEFAAFLSMHLPSFGDGWWKTHVEDRLSFQQQRTVQRCAAYGAETRYQMFQVNRQATFYESQL